MKQSKVMTRVIQIFSVMVLAIAVLYTVKNTGITSNHTTELVYWERARFLAGQGGATNYNGASLCALGYSLILAPVCMLFQSPFAAYKVAVLLNGCFLCGSYIMSVLAAKKLFPKENETVLSAACFFVALCPVLATAKSFTGPEMLGLLLLWSVVYLLTLIWEKAVRRRVVFLTVCLIFLPFFKIQYIGISVAALLVLAFFVKKKRLDELAFLKMILAVLIGVAAGNVFERTFLYNFSHELDVTVQSSLERWFDGLLSGWENGYLISLFNSLCGKIYVLSVSTFLMILPGVWFVVRSMCDTYRMRHTKHSGQEINPALIVAILFFVPLLFSALYDNSREISSGLTSLSGLETVTVLFLLFSLLQLKNMAEWSKDLIGYLLFLCTVTIVTAGIYQSNGVSVISSAGNGILMLFQNWGLKPVAIVYTAACLAMLSGIVFLFCLKNTVHRYNFYKISWVAGTLALFVVFFGSSILVLRHTSMKWNNSHMKNFAPIASVLSEAGSEQKLNLYYLRGFGNDKDLAIVQLLLPDQPIEMIPNDRKEQELFYEKIAADPEHSVIITGSDARVTDETMPEKLPEFKVMHMTKSYSIWTSRGTEAYEAVEAATVQRIGDLSLSKVEEIEEPIEDTELVDDTVVEEKGESADESAIEEDSTESKEEIKEAESETESLEKSFKRIKTYGENAVFAPGTYQMELHFVRQGEADKFDGTIKLFDSRGTILTKKVDEGIFDEKGNGAVIFEFSRQDVIRSFRVEVNGTFAASAKAGHIYYWKTSSDYTVGANGTNTVKSACQAILDLDAKCGDIGRVAYIGSIMQDPSDLSMRCFEECMPGYSVDVISKEDAKTADVEYLIAVTSAHAYFYAMNQYSSIFRGTYYTVLVRNDSRQYETFVKSGEEFRTQGTSINYAYLTEEEGTDTPIELEAGSYMYHLMLKGTEEDLLQNDGSVRLVERDQKENKNDTYGEQKGKDVIIAEAVLADLEWQYGENGTVLFELPFTLRENAKALTVETDLNDEIAVVSVGISMTAEKYQYGADESEMQKLCDIVNALDGNVKLGVVQTAKTIQKEMVGYEYLQKLVPKAKVEEISFSKANNTTEDMLLLSYGLTSKVMRLTQRYSILGHAGQYTLWVRGDGELVQQAIENGVKILSNGGRMSLESIAAAGNVEVMGESVASLPKAVYNVFVKLCAEDMEIDDHVEVALLRDKSGKEIEKEIQELMEFGYTKKEAKRKVEPQIVCGIAEYEPYQFEDGALIAPIRTDGSKPIENLTAGAFSWYGCEIKVEILWVELA